jgi:hypothetical protein
VHICPGHEGGLQGRTVFVRSQRWRDDLCTRHINLKCSKGHQGGEQDVCLSHYRMFDLAVVGECLNCESDFTVSPDLFGEIADGDNTVLDILWEQI